MQELVDQELATGRYSSSEEVLIAAVELLREQDRRYDAFRAEVLARLKALDEGGAIELENESALSGFFDDISNR